MAGTFYYSLQQRILAADGELPFLHRAAVEGGADVVLRLLMQPAPQVTVREWHRGPELVIDRADGGELIVRFMDGTSFFLDDGGRSISLIAAPPQYTRDDLAAYALGPVIAIALHLQGVVLLHAAAVVIEGKAVVLAGDGGSGKSTTAAILHQQGYAVLADDVTEIAGDGPFNALASVPAVRLWPEALHALFGEEAVFPDRAPSWDKKMVLVPQTGGAEVAAILFLGAREAVAKLEPLAPRDAWLQLIANVYTALLPGETMRGAIFDVTTALADRIPSYSLTLPPIESCGELGAFLERELAEALR